MLHAALLLVASSLAAGNGAKPARPPDFSRCWVPAEIVAIHDGDTPTIRCPLPLTDQVLETKVRLLGVDTWEVGPRPGLVITEEEKAKGRLARDALDAICARGQLFVQPGRERRDRYGRPLVRAIIVEPGGRVIDVAAELIAGGHDRTKPAQPRPAQAEPATP